MPIELGQAFSLKVGESAHTADKDVRIGFDGVTADSRCPKGERCVWAGDATVRVWLQSAAGPKEVRELHTAPGAAQSVRVRSHSLRLVRLDPYPITGKPIAEADYIATLMLNSSEPADPER